MSDFVGHGYSIVEAFSDHCGKEKVSLHVGRLPGRKQLCLYGHNGSPSVINVYAFFPTEAKAVETLAILDRLMKR